MTTEPTGQATTRLTREQLAQRIAERFGDAVRHVPSSCGEIVFEVSAEQLTDVATALRDDTAFAFDMLMDVCGVDYLTYGNTEWKTDVATSSGFSRGVNRGAADDGVPDGRRFAVVYHLLSTVHNRRLRLRAYCPDNDAPMVESMVPVFSSADWYEREAFDLFGILFNGHPDLRRILTDYGFIGHPFRKDFPLIGNVEVRYDPNKGRVIYQPVSIEPRTLVPRVIRDDNRYDAELK